MNEDGHCEMEKDVTPFDEDLIYEIERAIEYQNA
jgi:hypothetical protein